MAVPLHGETRHSALRADELRAYPFSRVTLRHSLRVQEGGTTARIRNAAVMLPQDNSVKGASRPCWPWLKCVYAFTAGGHSRGRQSNFRVKMLQAALRDGRASCFHRYAAARRASMLFMPCPVQPGTKTSQCPAGSGRPLPWHTAKPPILTTGGLQCCCTA
jgi:hypothetical protein